MITRILLKVLLPPYHIYQQVFYISVSYHIWCW